MGAIFKLLMGSPWALAGMAFGLFLALTVSFGTGYYTAVSQAERIQVAAVVKAAKQQELLDLEIHRGALAENTIIVARNTKHDVQIKKVIERIPAITDGATCTITPEKIDELVRTINDASK